MQAQVNQLTAQFNKAVEQYDQVAEQLTAAKTRLSQVNKEMAGDQAKYDAARLKVVQIANASYMDSGQTSLAGLLTSNDPAQVLAETSIIMQLTGARNMETQYFLGIAQQVGSVQQEQQRTELGIQQLLGQRSQTKNNIQKLLKSKQDTLDSLTAPQQQQVLAGTLGGGGTTSGTYTGPTGTQADTAVAVRLRPARLPVRVRRHRPVQGRVRLLGARAGRLGGGGHLDPARHLRAVGRAAARLRVVDRAR